MGPLDDAQLSKIHWRITLLSAMGQFLDGYDLLIIGGALLLIVPMFKPSPATLGLLSASAFVGSFLGAIVAGWMGDKLGRRSILLWDLFFFVICSLGAGFSQNMTEIIIFRFLIGVGIGADLPVAYALIAETAPKRTRGRLLAAPLAMWGLGGVLAGLVGFLFITYGGPDAWRWMFWVGVLPALAVLALRRSLPETPRWLAAAGQLDKAKAVAATLMTEPQPEVASSPARIVPEVSRERQATRFGELFSSSYARRTWVGFLLMVVRHQGADHRPPLPPHRRHSDMAAMALVEHHGDGITRERRELTVALVEPVQRLPKRRRVGHVPRLRGVHQRDMVRHRRQEGEVHLVEVVALLLVMAPLGERAGRRRARSVKTFVAS